MFSIHKLKPDHSITGLIPALVSLFIAALIGIFVGKKAALLFLAFVFWGFCIYTLLGFHRTGNRYTLIPALYLFFGGWVLYLEEPSSRVDPSANWQLMLLLAGVFLLGTVYLLLTKKLKWRGREILELAAASVEETGNGYTNRPMPGGKTNFNRQQIMEFAEFASRNMIALPYVGENKVVFVPVMMGREFAYVLGMKKDYMDSTWIAFDFDGNVSVNISHRDYMEYQEALSFDQLCTSMGDLFIDLIETFQRGEGVRIITRLNNVRAGLFS